MKVINAVSTSEEPLQIDEKLLSPGREQPPSHFKVGGEGLINWLLMII